MLDSLALCSGSWMVGTCVVTPRMELQVNHVHTNLVGPGSAREGLANRAGERPLDAFLGKTSRKPSLHSPHGTDPQIQSNLPWQWDRGDSNSLIFS